MGVAGVDGGARMLAVLLGTPTVMDLPLSLGMRGGAWTVGVEAILFCVAAADAPICWWLVLRPGRGGRGGGAEAVAAPRLESMMLSGRAGSAGGCSPVS